MKPSKQTWEIFSLFADNLEQVDFSADATKGQPSFLPALS